VLAWFCLGEVQGLYVKHAGTPGQHIDRPSRPRLLPSTLGFLVKSFAHQSMIL